MFSDKTYKQRRDGLKKLMGGGVLFFPGNNEAPMNYPANYYKFRQDSNFLYYFGLDSAGLNAVIDADNNEEIIFGDDRSIDEVVWMGPQESLSERALRTGISKTLPSNDLTNYLTKTISSGKKIHFTAPYRSDIKIQFEEWFKIPTGKIISESSEKLIRSIISQRSVKSDEEVKEIEDALNISYEMNTLAMRYSKPGVIEREVYGAIEGIALGMGRGISFPVIFSVRGETLHNHKHENIMREGDLALLDSGAESNLHYASDITRTFPVGGKFTSPQRDIYNVVLQSQLEAIKMIKPGVLFRDIHLHSAKVIADGLKEIGLMKGDTAEAVAQGAHALFFPHGLGHMLGLDVHDMEGLGENYIGYSDTIKRSQQFGLAYLRFAKEMQPGHVITIEPGVYFIPKLIEQWRSEIKHADFINYDKLEGYLNFGGIRIEDDIIVTDTGSRVLGKPIPKIVEEVEAVCAS